MKEKPLPTVWTVPDSLWEHFIAPLLAEFDPPPKMGRPRANQRQCLDGILYRARTGCQWNHLPEQFGNDATVHRTLKRWDEKGIFDKLWALLIYHCEDLHAVHWEWQSADGTLYKARFIGKKGGKANRVPPKAGESAPTPVTGERWGVKPVSLSREAAARYLRASREPT